MALQTRRRCQGSQSAAGGSQPPPLRPTGHDLSLWAIRSGPRRRLNILGHAPAAAQQASERFCACELARRMEPLGLRPRADGPIGAAASTRLASQATASRACRAEARFFAPSPADGGGSAFSERCQSGRELLGGASAAADAELMRLLLGLHPKPVDSRPATGRLLAGGSHGVLGALLDRGAGGQAPRLPAGPHRFQPLGHRRPGGGGGAFFVYFFLGPPAGGRLHNCRSCLQAAGQPAAGACEAAAAIGPIPARGAGHHPGKIVRASGRSGLGVGIQLEPSLSSPNFNYYDGIRSSSSSCQGGRRRWKLPARWPLRRPGWSASALNPSRGSRGWDFGFRIEEIRA